MNDIIEKINIENMIYEIRGKQVMLDSDLAYLFNYETKDLNRNVKNNIKRFLKNYCFQLTKEEYENLRCKNFTSSLNENYGGRRYLPYVFTEHGITMLAGILKSEKAIQISLKIVDQFIKMRKFIKGNIIDNNIYNMLINHDNKINYIDNELKLLEEAFNKFEEKEMKNKLFYDGKLYDAYSFIIDILNRANNEIIIIDNYADKLFLDIIKNIDKNTILITKNNNNLKDIDISKYNKQYHNLKIIYSNLFHDRFIILDKNKLYLLGSSINYIGNKVTSIILIEDDLFKNDLLNKIKKLI